MQSVFNRGECMMHVNKNADGHVLDQNVDRISREIAYVPLSGRIRSKRSSCMQPFFFFFLEKNKKILSTRHAYQWSDGLILDVLPRGPLKLNFGRASQRSDGLKFGRASQRSNGLKSWMCFLEVRWFEFGRASQRFDGLKFGCASQRSNEIEFWTCFLEVRWIEVWTSFPEVRWICGR